MDTLPNPAPPVQRTSASDLERRLCLAASLLDHGLAVRDNYAPVAREAWLEQVEREVRMALDGAGIEQIAAAR